MKSRLCPLEGKNVLYSIVALVTQSTVSGQHVKVCPEPESITIDWIIWVGPCMQSTVKV